MIGKDATMKEYTTSDFDYDLDESLIAKYPLTERSASRLLCLDRSRQSLDHRQFVDIAELIEPNDLLVLNNTKVIPARIFGKKASGGKIECLVERIIGEDRFLAHIRASKAPKPGVCIEFTPEFRVQVVARHGELFELTSLNSESVLTLLEQYGQMPLPPYIDRIPDDSDQTRYQTVFAKEQGAVAAPTAGLHFDQPLLDKIKSKGVQFAHVTLHVGAGTFQPVRVENLDEHHMHHEYMLVDQALCDAVKACRERGGRVIAVGTTSVRCLETAAAQGDIKPFQGDTNLFIKPGYQFKAVDALITNFHLPKSTLLMLVSTFAGYDFIKQSYAIAVQEKYRFFSYGDAMFIS